MKVVIAEDLFAVEALGLHLTTLLLIGALDWGHRVIIDGPQAGDGPLATWLDQHRPGPAAIGHARRARRQPPDRSGP